MNAALEVLAGALAGAVLAAVAIFVPAISTF
jgi:hypothetical protein